MNLEDLVKLHNPISEKDIVIDVGGYRGDYAQAIFDRFKCGVVVFEPNAKIYETLLERFKENYKIQCNPTAIGGEHGVEKLYLREDGSSFFHEWAGTDEWVGVVVGKLSDFIQVARIVPKIVKLNCEGAEYAIIEDLEKSGFLGQIDEVLVQFHRIPNWKILQDSAERRLSKTHEKVYNYKWQLWRRTQVNTGIRSGRNIVGVSIPQKS